MTEPIFLGIDPGRSGAIAWIQSSTVSVEKMPADKELASFFWDRFGEDEAVRSRTVAVVERVDPRPLGSRWEYRPLSSETPANPGERQGWWRCVRERVPTWMPISHFGKLAHHEGRILMALEMLSIETTRMRPRDWQRVLGFSGDAKKTKNREMARRLFKAARVTVQNADALLLAEVCRRTCRYALEEAPF